MIEAALLAENRRRSPDHDEDDIRAIAASADGWSDGSEVNLSSAHEARPWPEPIGEEAYHGVAGELVNAVAGETEADPVGLLASILTTAGALFGHARTLYQGSEQAPNLYAVLVGETAAARKGTGGRVVRNIFNSAAPGWESIMLPGLGSGEGLVGHLHREAEQARREHRPAEHRALVLETEIGRLLTVMGREGSTLSPMLRDAWDGAPLGRFLAREDMLVAWHHVAVLGHVTPADLRAKLTSTEAANGFGNRFLWIAVRRTKLVPFPGNPAPLVAPYLAALRQAIDAAQTPGELTWAPNAAERWEKLYSTLATHRRLGLLGALTARAEAQIARLALVYALLDCSRTIELVHLEAAIAVWGYAERSAIYVFGESTGNRHADLVLRLLREGLEIDRQTVKSETGLRLGADIDDVIGVLVDADLVEVVKVPRPDGTGRPRRVLRLRNRRNGRNGQAPACEDSAY